MNCGAAFGARNRALEGAIRIPAGYAGGVLAEEQRHYRPLLREALEADRRGEIGRGEDRS
jgi:hypothetical protein